MMNYKSKEESLLREGCVTAFIDKTYPSNLAYKPQFISNNYKEGRKVISSIEDWCGIKKVDSLFSRIS